MLRRAASGLLVPLLAVACSSDPPTRPKPDPICTTCGPDLVVDEAALAAVVELEEHAFAATDCEVGAGCVGTAGDRRLLLFGPAVRHAGDRPAHPDEEDWFAPRCGDARVLAGFLGWRILDEDGATVRDGAADLDCLADGSPGDESAPAASRFSCDGEQGLQPGWVTDPTAAGTCLFADVTDLLPGDYEFELEVNASGAILETRLENNTGRVPFRIEPPVCAGLVCGAHCCPPGIPCEEGRCALPDLTIDEEALRQSIRVDEANFSADDCAVDEGCVGDTGLRRLLRFTLSTPNVGGADLFVGDPAESEEAEWSSCHQHFHMVEFASYRLVRQDGTVAAEGHKQAFCLMDTEPAGDWGPTAPRYDCGYQGISKGWSDSYGSGLDCQWVDVTGVPEGDYFLDVEINGARRYPELHYDNNAARIPVYLPADPSQCVPREEVCGDGRDQDCDGVPDDGCAPLSANDTCAAAWHLDGSGTWTGFIGASAARDGGGSCGGAGGTLHFSLQVLSEEIVYLSTYGSAIDTVLRVERGRCGETTEVSCTDDGCGADGSHFAGVLGPGTYDVIVQAKEPTTTGVIELTAQRSGCSGARPIEGPGSYDGNTAGAGADTMTSCGLGGGPDELWFFATCPGETPIELTTCGAADFDTVLELRQASCRGLPASCNDDQLGGTCPADGGSTIRRRLEGEGLWFVVVDGYLSTDGGAYTLDVTGL